MSKRVNFALFSFQPLPLRLRGGRGLDPFLRLNQCRFSKAQRLPLGGPIRIESLEGSFVGGNAGMQRFDQRHDGHQLLQFKARVRQCAFQTAQYREAFRMKRFDVGVAQHIRQQTFHIG